MKAKEKNPDYYSRYDHFLKCDLKRVGSFLGIKNWLRGRKKIVDVGCGLGHLTSFWHAQGLDNDAYAIKNARRLFPKTKFILGDVTREFPFKTDSLDAIVCYNSLEHLPDQGRRNFFKEAQRTLKNNGLFIAAYIDENYWFNRLIAFLRPDQGASDPTHLVSWNPQDFRKEVGRYFKITREKRTSPFGRLIFLTRFFKAEVLLSAKNVKI